MTIKNIYDAALRLLGEKPDETRDSELSARAEYLAAAFCCDIAAIDRDYRASHKYEPQKPFNELFLELNTDFPLSSRFSKACSHYIAAMLVVDEDEALSDKLFEKYCDSLASAVSEIPCKREKIRNIYG